MTWSPLTLITAVYAAAFAAIAYATGARGRRIQGALAGGGAAGAVLLIGVSVGEARGWWRVPAPRDWLLQCGLWFGAAVSCAPIYPITWRLARRFGGWGPAAFALCAAVIGAPRDYATAAAFPDWIVFSPGRTPILAVATVYALIVLAGHGAMRVIAGPSRGDVVRERGERGAAWGARTASRSRFLVPR